jgi:hypothetical protein
MNARAHIRPVGVNPTTAGREHIPVRTLASIHMHARHHTLTNNNTHAWFIPEHGIPDFISFMRQGDMQLKRAIQHATKTLEKMQQH